MAIQLELIDSLSVPVADSLHCGHPSDPLDAGCQRCPRIVLHRVIVQQVVL